MYIFSFTQWLAQRHPRPIDHGESCPWIEQRRTRRQDLDQPTDVGPVRHLNFEQVVTMVHGCHEQAMGGDPDAHDTSLPCELQHGSRLDATNPLHGTEQGSLPHLRIIQRLSGRVKPSVHL